MNYTQCGSALALPYADGIAQTCVTSPPYYGLRLYLPPGHPSAAQELGTEQTPAAYVAQIVAAMREVWRVLRDDGTLWLNIGDSYASKGTGNTGTRVGLRGKQHQEEAANRPDKSGFGIAEKNLLGIPWRVAFALQDDGWVLRSDTIWCLSGGTWLYVKTQSGGECLMTVKDMARLNPYEVSLWNGEKWTRLLGMSKSARRGDEIELVLRSGERISCTPTHKFPTGRGLIDAGDLVVGDVLKSVRLPAPETPKDCALDLDAAWFAGLYLAEGSRSGEAIQITGHVSQAARWSRVQQIAAKFGGTATKTDRGNTQNIRVYGRVLVAILDELVSGRIAKDKGFAPPVWRYSNDFLASMVNGYLSGDGAWDEKNNRWRLAFTRNYNLERDLRTACARLGWHLTLKLATVRYDGRDVPTFRGELRKTRSGDSRQKDSAEIVEIRKARCRYVYDLGVEDEPHVFALASGILTHNSKPNPMPESVTDRPTKAHEYVFLLAKQPRYFYDAEAIREDVKPNSGVNMRAAKFGDHRADGNYETVTQKTYDEIKGANARSVWTIATTPYSGAHFATMPPELARRCILAGSSARGQCPKCGAPWHRVIEKGLTAHDGETDSAYEKGTTANRLAKLRQAARERGEEYANGKVTTGWAASCDCHAGDPVPQIVLDPFAGSGTTAMVALQNGRRAIGTELNPAYLRLQDARTQVTLGLGM